MWSFLSGDLTDIPGVGPKTAEKLKRLGVSVPEDLLLLFPRRYIDRSRVDNIADVLRRLKDVDQMATASKGSTPVTVYGTVSKTKVSRTSNPRLWTIKSVVTDGTGHMSLVWFARGFGGKPPKAPVRDGEKGVAVGTPKLNTATGGVEMASPKWEVVSGHRLNDGFPPIPVYPLTEGLSKKQVDMCIDWALTHMSDRSSLPVDGQAFWSIHRPQSMDDVEKGRRQIALAELTQFQMDLHRRREHVDRLVRFPCLPRKLPPESFFSHLPFSPTNAQRRAIHRLVKAFSQTQSQSILLQGDVGSGKTLVAAYAGALAVKSGHQAVLMAPTRLLAEQHARTLTGLLTPFGISPVLISARTKAHEKQALIQELSSEKPLFVIGTHAVISQSMNFPRLSLAIVDEQHRFGVAQRGGFQMNGAAHKLSMSATPIPRTAALVLYGDDDVVRLDEMPPGRSPVDTRWIDPAKRGDVYRFVRRRVDAGERAYVVWPRIHADDQGHPGLLSAYHEAREKWFRGIAVGVLHGEMDEAQQEQVMDEFVSGHTKVLFATSIIEVGVDVPEATVIVIEEAERFGLAQLHQLRGRVGRGEAPGTALLIAEPKNEAATARIDTLRRVVDGFQIAELDLKLRGPGEVLGTRQSGETPFVAADLFRDEDLLELVRDQALRLQGDVSWSG